MERGKNFSPKALFYKDSTWGLLFAIPFFLGIFIFIVVPFFASIYLSLTKFNMIKPSIFIGIANYKELILKDERFYQAIKNTLYFSMMIVPLNVTVTLTIAWFLTQIRRGSLLFLTIFFLPLMSSAIAFAIVWKYIWNFQIGPINLVLYYLFNVEGPDWLGNAKLALPCVVITQLFKGMGLNIVILYAGLQGILKEYYESAAIDGASRFKQFIYITIPMLSPTIYLVIMLTIIGSFKVFDTIYALTTPPSSAAELGGPAGATTTMSLFLYKTGFLFFLMGKASAVGIVLFLFILTFTLIQWKLRRKLVFQEEGV